MNDAVRERELQTAQRLGLCDGSVVPFCRIPKTFARELGLAHDVVVEYSPQSGGFTDTHERITRAGIARRLAALMDFDYAGEYNCSSSYCGRVYFVPSNTLVGIDQAARLGITVEHHLFGGVVPYRFVATKAITHPLIERTFLPLRVGPTPSPARCKGLCWRGIPFLLAEHAYSAGKQLLENGPVRLKLVHATAGRGQKVIQNLSELAEALATMAPAEWADAGLVLEENLTSVTTYSVGQVRVADLTATYYGSQRLTNDNAGDEVYGGSDLVLVRGDFNALSQLPAPENIRIAVEQAQVYDAATEVFSGMFASRRNYDVVRGPTLMDSGVRAFWSSPGASAAPLGPKSLRSKPSELILTYTWCALRRTRSMARARIRHRRPQCTFAGPTSG